MIENLFQLGEGVAPRQRRPAAGSHARPRAGAALANVVRGGECVDPGADVRHVSKR